MKGLRFNGSMTAGVLVASSMLTFCQPVRAWQPKIEVPVSAGNKTENSQKPETAATDAKPGSRKSAPQIISSRWAGGECSFDNGRNTLTYTDGAKKVRASIRLDEQVRGGTEIVCSKRYTVIISPGIAIIALGGERIFAGEMSMDDVRTGNGALWNNSYWINISDAQAEGLRGARVSGDDLVLNTKKQVWKTDMTDLRSPWRTTY